MNSVNNSIACACAVSHWWLPSLHEVSPIAADLLPILGAVYISLQIVFVILKKGRGGDSET